MTDGNRCFVDTNVLLAATDKDRASHAAAIAFLEDGLCGQRRLFANGQVFREYLVVATRPTDVNGLGLTSELALANIRQFQQCIQVLEETSEVAEWLFTLIRRHDLSGKRIHDANIAATMRAHGLTHLGTDNPDDFGAFEGIQIIPASATE